MEVVSQLEVYFDTVLLRSYLIPCVNFYEADVNA